MQFIKLATLGLALGMAGGMSAQQTMVVVKPVEIHDVLVNPGIGFMTFQRFNGDALNGGTKWTEGFPIQYQQSPGTLENKDFPETSIAYFRVYWRFLEPEKGVYNWGMIDRALQTAHARHQTLMLRIAPHGTDEASDVPAWYRQETGEKFHKIPGGWDATTGKWLIDPENPAYAKEFGDCIRALGNRYDGVLTWTWWIYRFWRRGVRGRNKSADGKNAARSDRQLYGFFSQDAAGYAAR